MAYTNRARFSSQNYGFGFNRNDYQSGPMNRNNHPLMRNCNGNIPMPLHRFPGAASHNMAGPYTNRPPPFPGTNDIMMRPPPFRGGRPMMNGNRMPLSNMTIPQGYPDPALYRDGPPRMRFPNAGGSGNERFFVPWNQRPKPFFGQNKGPARNNPRPPTNNQSKSQPKVEDKPKRKRNKKRKYSARPKEDSKKLKPWMTDEIYEEVRKKNEMYVKCKNEDKPELWQEFRLLRNRVSSLIKDAKLKGGFITRKQKEEDNTERPFSCDTCDRAFVDEAELETHVKEHVKCDVDGCHFDAHPKVVELHKKMQHETGYATTIMKLNTDEEIQKWREERKNHYPTAENIKKRQAELQEKTERGEVVAPKEFGKFRKRGANIRNQNGRRFDNQRNSWRARRTQERRTEAKLKCLQDWQAPPPAKRQKFESDEESNSEEETHIKLHPFPGMVESNTTQSLEHAENISTGQSSMDFEISQNNVTLDTDQSCVRVDWVARQCNSSAENSSDLKIAAVELPSRSSDFMEGARMLDVPLEENGKVSSDVLVMGAHTTPEDVRLQECSSSQNLDVVVDSDDEGPTVLKISKEPMGASPEQKNSLENTEFDTSAKAKEGSVSHDKKCDRRPVRVKSDQNAVKTSTMVKNSLLEKLLVKEITHERNVILQCIRYTVKNNFFRG